MRKKVVIGLLSVGLIAAGAGVMWMIDQENETPQISAALIPIPGGGSQRGVPASYCWPSGLFGYTCADGEFRYPSPRDMPPGPIRIQILDGLQPAEISLQRLPQPGADEAVEVDSKVVGSKGITSVEFDLPACRDNFLNLHAYWRPRPNYTDRSASWAFWIRTTGC